MKENLHFSTEVCTFALANGHYEPIRTMVSGFSAVGSAHVWGARGRWFESSNPDQKEEGFVTTTSPLFVPKL